MAARLNRMHQEAVRAKIRASELMNVLHDDAFGIKPMSDGARTSAIYLITQSIGKPHQSMAVEHTHNHASELTDAVLGDIATRSRTGATETPQGPLNS